MAKSQRNLVLLLSIVAIIGGIAWAVCEPGFEPVLFVIAGLIGLFSIWWPTRKTSYASKRLTGKAKFDYSNNNGKYTIGSGELIFETAWSKASDTSIHIYNDPPSIHSLALASKHHSIQSIHDIQEYDFSSRSRTAQEGEIVVLRNKYGNYAAIKILNVKDSSRSDSVDEISFEYVINPNGKVDFK